MERKKIMELQTGLEVSLGGFAMEMSMNYLEEGKLIAEARGITPITNDVLFAEILRVELVMNERIDEILEEIRTPHIVRLWRRFKEWYRNLTLEHP